MHAAFVAHTAAVSRSPHPPAGPSSRRRWSWHGAARLLGHLPATCRVPRRGRRRPRNCFLPYVPANVSPDKVRFYLHPLHPHPHPLPVPPCFLCSHSLPSTLASGVTNSSQNTSTPLPVTPLLAPWLPGPRSLLAPNRPQLHLPQLRPIGQLPVL